VTFPVKPILLLLLLPALATLSGCRATYGGAGYDGTSDRSTFNNAQQSVIDLHRHAFMAQAEAAKNAPPLLRIEACEGCELTISGLKLFEVHAPVAPFDLGGIPALDEVKPYVHPGWGVATRAIDVVANPLVAFGFANEMMKNALKYASPTIVRPEVVPVPTQEIRPEVVFGVPAP
jgi:hypothetical protein